MHPVCAQQGQSYQKQSQIADISCAQESFAEKANHSIHRCTPFSLCGAFEDPDCPQVRVSHCFQYATLIQLLLLLLADTPPQSESILAARKPLGPLTKRTKFEQVVILYIGIARTSRWEAFRFESLTIPANR
jgi:hypothetical protein